MNSSNTFWRSVEAIGWGAREAALREHLGETYPQLAPFLIPSPTLTYQMACERTRDGHGCRYRIVEEPETDGTHAAVCDEGRCPTKFYRRRELVRYTVNLRTLGETIARSLGLHPQLEERRGGVWVLGQISGGEWSVPVLFAREKHEDRMKTLLERLFLEGAQRFVLVAPSSRYLGDGIQQWLTRFDGQSLALDEVTELKAGEIVLTAAGKVRWQKLKEAIGGPSVLGVTFPTPAGAQWWDLTLRFRDGHTLLARIGQASMKLSFQDLGMEDGRSKAPNKQWKLLRAFAEERGVLDWSSRHAHPRNQKQKELLANRLSRFFGIEGEPIRTINQGERWETVFNIHET